VVPTVLVGTVEDNSLSSSLLGVLAGMRMIYRHRRKLGRWPNVLQPRTYNERIIHRALFDRDPALRQMSDKIEVKRLVAERVGERYAVPLLGEWSDPMQVDFDRLGPSYVLKPNAQSGPYAMVLDSATADRAALLTSMRSWLAAPGLRKTLRRQWGYFGIAPLIIAEPLLRGPDGGPAPELDVFVFRGKAQLFRHLHGRKLTPERRNAWFDRNGRQLAIATRKLRNETPVLARGLIEEAADLAERVSEGSAHLRVDFYATADGLRIGELTPYTHGGRVDWVPRSLDLQLGRWWVEPADPETIPDFDPGPPSAAESRSGPSS
jgi:hypothetical protein